MTRFQKNSERPLETARLPSYFGLAILATM